MRACKEALTVITTMAMSSDRRYGSAIDYMLLQISLLSNFRQGSLGRIRSFPGTHGKCTPANGVEDGCTITIPIAIQSNLISYECEDKPIGWPWTTFALTLLGGPPPVALCS